MTGNVNKLFESEHAYALVEKNMKSGLQLAMAGALNGVFDSFSSARDMTIGDSFKLLLRVFFLHII